MLIFKSKVGLALTFLLVGCSDAADQGPQMSETLTKQIEAIETEEIDRFIVSVRPDEDKSIQMKSFNAAIAAFNNTNVTSVESLDGERLLLVIGNKYDLQEAAKTGLIDSVRVDVQDPPQ